MGHCVYDGSVATQLGDGSEKAGAEVKSGSDESWRDRQANVERGREASSSNRTREMERTFETFATVTESGTSKNSSYRIE